MLGAAGLPSHRGPISEPGMRGQRRAGLGRSAHEGRREAAARHTAPSVISLALPVCEPGYMYTTGALKVAAAGRG